MTSALCRQLINLLCIYNAILQEHNQGNPIDRAGSATSRTNNKRSQSEMGDETTQTFPKLKRWPNYWHLPAPTVAEFENGPEIESSAAPNRHLDSMESEFATSQEAEAGKENNA